MSQTLFWPPFFKRFFFQIPFQKSKGNLELAQFPVTEGWGRKRTSKRASARLAQGVVDAIWLDLGALNQG